MNFVTRHHIRDNEVIVADINPKCDTNGHKAFSDTNTVLVNYTLPGRAPVVLDSQEKVMVCPSRGGMDIQVRDPHNIELFIFPSFSFR